MSELISDVKVWPLREPKNGLLANVSFTVSESFVLKAFLRQGKEGMFVAQPSQKGTDKDGNDKYYEHHFPISREARAEMTEKVIEAYNQKTNGNAESTKTKKKSDGVPF